MRAARLLRARVRSQTACVRPLRLILFSESVQSAPQENGALVISVNSFNTSSPL